MPPIRVKNKSKKRKKTIDSTEKIRYSLPAMQTTLEIQMELENDTIVNIEATYSKDKGDYLTPPHESMEIDSVTLDDGTEYELDSYEEKRAIIELYEELRARGED
jgi:hypothetical protein